MIVNSIPELYVIFLTFGIFSCIIHPFNTNATQEQKMLAKNYDNLTLENLSTPVLLHFGVEKARICFFPDNKQEPQIRKTHSGFVIHVGFQWAAERCACD